MKHKYITLLLMANLLLLVACQPALLNPPRLATQEAPPPPTPTPLILNAPTPTGKAIAPPPEPITAVTPNPTLTLWVNQTAPHYRQALQTMAAEFSQLHGINLELVLIPPSRLPDLVETATISNTLPDVVLHPLQYSVGWAEKRILDAPATQTVLAELGENSFDPQALALLQTTNGIAALPSDGWQQLIIYRQDWFDQLNLAPPTTYAALERAASAIYRSETISARTAVSNTLISGLVVPTEATLPTTQYVFEQLATANGCRLIDTKGEITFIHPDCLDALDFYRDLINSYSPSDIQTDISALNAYRSGRTGIIFASPHILPILAGLSDAFPPTCAECAQNPAYLAQNSGIVTQITGRSERAQAANFGQTTNLGITRTADTPLAQRFLNYWFTQGYLHWLAIEPEHTIPLRLGTAENPTQFSDTWATLPLNQTNQPLNQLYNDTLVAQISNNLTNTPRWGFRERQGALITELYQQELFPIILQEMLSGYFTSSQAVIETHQRVVALIPNYAYHNDDGD